MASIFSAAAIACRAYPESGRRALLLSRSRSCSDAFCCGVNSCAGCAYQEVGRVGQRQDEDNGHHGTPMDMRFSTAGSNLGINIRSIDVGPFAENGHSPRLVVNVLCGDEIGNAEDAAIAENQQDGSAFSAFPTSHFISWLSDRTQSILADARPKGRGNTAFPGCILVVSEDHGMLTDDTFQDLLRRVRAGDQQAAAEVVRACEPEIRRIVRLRLTDARLRRAARFARHLPIGAGELLRPRGDGAVRAGNAGAIAQAADDDGTQSFAQSRRETASRPARSAPRARRRRRCARWRGRPSGNAEPDRLGGGIAGASRGPA